MAVLTLPSTQEQISDPEIIRKFLTPRGVFFDQWQANIELASDADQETILSAYEHVLTPFMQKGGYQVADVINIHPAIDNYPQIRAKFLAEHIHTEDEVRFFVEGEGLFWFNLETEEHPVFCLRCQAGDLISVPKNTKHWFDAGEEKPNVKAIRIFIDTAGWVPHYTESGIENNYL